MGRLEDRPVAGVQASETNQALGEKDSCVTSGSEVMPTHATHPHYKGWGITRPGSRRKSWQVQLRITLKSMCCKLRKVRGKGDGECREQIPR